MRVIFTICLSIFIFIGMADSLEPGKLLHDCIIYRLYDKNYCLQLDGSSPRTELSIGGYGIVISPDGRKLAFRKDGYLTVSDADGTNAIKLVEANVYGMVFSPDGDHLAYVIDNYYGWSEEMIIKNRSELRSIYMIKTDGSDQAHLYNGEARVQFSPDGKRIIYKINDDLFVMDLDSRKSLNLTNGQYKVDSALFVGSGAKIAFLSYGERYHLTPYIVDTDGQNLSRISEEQFNGYSHDLVVEGDPGKRKFYIIDLVSGNLRLIIKDEDWFANPVKQDWGKDLLFIPDSAEMENIVHNLMAHPYPEQGNVIRVGSDVVEDFSYYGCKLSPDGKYAVLYMGYSDSENAFLAVTNLFEPKYVYWIGNVGVGGTIVSMAPSLIDGKLLDTYGNWHSLDE